jgi:hypothetical protein
VPGRYPLFREAALALFLVAVALGLWLAEVRPLVVVAVMALALAVAWVIEWFSWREDQLRSRAPAAGVVPTEVVQETTTVTPSPPRARGLWLLRGDRAARAAREAEAAASVAPAEPEAAPPAPTEPEPEAEAAPSQAAPEPEAPTPSEQAAPTPSEPAAPTASETAAPEPPPAVAGEPRRSRRRLQPVRSATPTAPPAEPPPAAPPPEAEDAPVVPLWARSAQPRQWNLWDLERIARAQSRREPERYEEWSYLFLHLRRFATADGMLPAEFDGLVRDYFRGLLEPAQGA